MTICKVVGVIHARGGSVRIPLKNIKPLGGIPLIGYIIRAALAARTLDRLIVSTDHPDIKRVSLEFGAEVPFDRPKEISSDCPSEYVTQHAVSFVEAEQGHPVSIAVTMQPTTPFVRAEDIDACVDMVRGNPAWNSAFTGKKVLERPEWMFSVAPDRTAALFMAGQFEGERGVSQCLPEMIMPNGAVYATRREELMENGRIIAPNTAVHVMRLEDSVDIDEPLDFEFAEFLLSKRREGSVA